MVLKNTNTKKFLEISSNSIVFTKERLDYLKKTERHFKKLLENLALDYKIEQNEVTIFTNSSTRDPCAILKGSSILSVLARGAPLEAAILFSKKDDCSFEIVDIEKLSSSKEVMINRRNRLLEEETLNAIEEMTKCKLFVYGKTATVIGNFRGVSETVRIIINCMDNKHPVYELRRLMVKKELQNNKNVKKEDWENLLPEVKKKVKKTKK